MIAPSKAIVQRSLPMSLFTRIVEPSSPSWIPDWRCAKAGVGALRTASTPAIARAIADARIDEGNIRPRTADTAAAGTRAGQRDSRRWLCIPPCYGRAVFRQAPALRPDRAAALRRDAPGVRAGSARRGARPRAELAQCGDRPVDVRVHAELARDHAPHDAVPIDHERDALDRHQRHPAAEPSHAERLRDRAVAVREEREVERVLCDELLVRFGAVHA